MPGKKFVSPLSPLQLEWLLTIENSPLESRLTRTRAQGIRLSHLHYSINDISQICRATRKTVSGWIHHWETDEFDSLLEAPRNGRPLIIQQSDHAEIIDIVKETPRQTKSALQKIKDKFNKTISQKTLKRIIKKKLHWGRARKSLKSKRDEEQFREAQQDLEILKGADDRGTIDLYYFDGSGFTGVPEVPYAWQDPDDPTLLPSEKTKRINALGFMNRKSDLFVYTFEDSVNSPVVTACFDEFIATLKNTTIVVIDNAPIHHSEWFDHQIERWEEEGLYLYFIPTYSPELNLIEILWKHIKYYWLSLAAYISFDALRKEVDRVLANVGTEYKIQFT